MKKITPLIICCLLSLSATHLFAQEAEFEKSTIEREKKAEDTSIEAFQKAKEKRIFEKIKSIPFENILQDPDNFEQNLAYAKQQIAEDNLLGAAATLERILLINPDLSQIRLFYAVVLFRLDDLMDASQELNKIKALEMPQSLRDEVNFYLARIRQRQKPTRLQIRETVGFQYDTNRNAAPSSKRRLLAEVPVGLTGSNRKQGDTSFLNVTNVDVSHKLPTQAGHELIGSFTYYLGEQTKVDSLDLQSLQYEFGGIYKTRFFNFTPTFSASHVSLSRETFLRTQAGNFMIDKSFQKFDLFSAFRIERQDYSGVDENPIATQRKGNFIELSGGANYKLTQNTRLMLAMVYDNKNAKADFNAYERLGFQTTHTWLLGKGQFLINGADFNLDYYDEPDTAIAGRDRRDRSIRYRATYGVPITFLLIGKILPKSLQDITVTATYEYFHSHSTITNYSYTNHKFQGLLIKRWEF